MKQLFHFRFRCQVQDGTTIAEDEQEYITLGEDSDCDTKPTDSR